MYDSSREKLLIEKVKPRRVSLKEKLMKMIRTKMTMKKVPEKKRMMMTNRVLLTEKRRH